MHYVFLEESLVVVVVVVSSFFLSYSPPVARRLSPFFVPMMDTSIRLVTCAHCAGVVELVCSGDISVTDGIDRLIVFRRSGTSDKK